MLRQVIGAPLGVAVVLWMLWVFVLALPGS